MTQKIHYRRIGTLRSECRRTIAYLKDTQDWAEVTCKRCLKKKPKETR